MRNVIWIVGAVLVLLWTATCVGGYWLLNITAEAAQHGAAMSSGLAPEWQYWTQWALRLVEGMGGVVIWITWTFGTLFIAAGTWAVAFIAKRLQTHSPRSIPPA